MRTNKAVIPLVLAGLATGAAVLYMLGTENGMNFWNKGKRLLRNTADDRKHHVIGHYNDRSYQKKHPVEDIESAIL